MQFSDVEIWITQIEIGWGLGPMSNQIWRVGLMCETAKKESIYKLIDAFREILD